MTERITKKPLASEITYALTVSDREFRFSSSIEAAISKAEIEITEIDETIASIENLRPQCDKIDYILAASSGALCGVIDIFLVGKPEESPLGKITDKWFENRVKDFAFFCSPDGKKFENLASALDFLENKFKVAYDRPIVKGEGISPGNHRFKSLAHNPSLLGQR